MGKRIIREKQARRNRPRELRELLERSARQPGIETLMEVYRAWQTVHNAAEPHRRNAAARRVVWVSSDSGPAV